MEGTAINLKYLLNGLADLREHVNDLYRSIKKLIGDDATFIHEWVDLRRIQLDEEPEQLEGDTLISDVLRYCWSKMKDYLWHFKGETFRLTPFRLTDGDTGFIVCHGDKHENVSFRSVVDYLSPDPDDSDSIWSLIGARIFNVADGLLADNGLKWNPGYSVDPSEVVKVPEEADGTLACADPAPAEDFYACLDKVVDEPVPEEVPVPKPKKNWKEKRSAEKDLIRAGGPSPKRYG